MQAVRGDGLVRADGDGLDPLDVRAGVDPADATASTSTRIPLQVSNLPDQGEQLRAGSMIGWVELNS